MKEKNWRNLGYFLQVVGCLVIPPAAIFMVGNWLKDNDHNVLAFFCRFIGVVSGMFLAAGGASVLMLQMQKLGVLHLSTSTGFFHAMSSMAHLTSNLFSHCAAFFKAMYNSQFFQHGIHFFQTHIAPVLSATVLMYAGIAVAGLYSLYQLNRTRKLLKLLSNVPREDISKLEKSGIIFKAALTGLVYGSAAWFAASALWLAAHGAVIGIAALLGASAAFPPLALVLISIVAFAFLLKGFNKALGYFTRKKLEKNAECKGYAKNRYILHNNRNKDRFDDNEFYDDEQPDQYYRSYTDSDQDDFSYNGYESNHK
ncbi:MAG: hypothetical protein GY821_09575 [Gammaproteobacteria bacterium]|nr:hypothetical protein [Gammaproteobacteria bacterium]